jgi:hypothetical protein
VRSVPRLGKESIVPGSLKPVSSARELQVPLDTGAEAATLLEAVTKQRSEVRD